MKIQFRNIFGKSKGNIIRVYSGIPYELFVEGYNPQIKQFDKSKITRKLESEIYVTIKPYCGYSRKWAVHLSRKYGSFPVVFSGMIDKAKLEYYHKGLIWKIPSGKLNVDELYRIISEDDNFLNIKQEDNTFEKDSDISKLLISLSEPTE